MLIRAAQVQRAEFSAVEVNGFLFVRLGVGGQPAVLAAVDGQMPLLDIEMLNCPDTLAYGKGGIRIGLINVRKDRAASGRGENRDVRCAFDVDRAFAGNVLTVQVKDDAAPQIEVFGQVDALKQRYRYVGPAHPIEIQTQVVCREAVVRCLRSVRIGELCDSLRIAVEAATVFVKIMRIIQGKENGRLVARLIDSGDIRHCIARISEEVVIAILILRQGDTELRVDSVKVVVRYAEDDFRGAVFIERRFVQQLCLGRDQLDRRGGLVELETLGGDKGHVARCVRSADVNEHPLRKIHRNGERIAVDRRKAAVIIDFLQNVFKKRIGLCDVIRELNAVPFGIKAALTVAVVIDLKGQGQLVVEAAVKGDAVADRLLLKVAAERDGRGRGVRCGTAVGRAADRTDRRLKVGRGMRMVVAGVVAGSAAGGAETVFKGMLVRRDHCVARKLKGPNRGALDSERRPIVIACDVDVLAVRRKQQIALGKEAANEVIVSRIAEMIAGNTLQRGGCEPDRRHIRVIKPVHHNRAFECTGGGGQAAAVPHSDGAGGGELFVCPAAAAVKHKILQHDGDIGTVDINRVAVAEEELRLTGFTVEGVVEPAVLDRDVCVAGELDNVFLRIRFQRLFVEVKGEAAGACFEIAVAKVEVAQWHQGRAFACNRRRPCAFKGAVGFTRAVRRGQRGDIYLIMAVLTLAVCVNVLVSADKTAGTFVLIVGIFRKFVLVLRYGNGLIEEGIVAVNDIAVRVRKGVALRQKESRRHAALMDADIVEGAAGQCGFSDLVNSEGIYRDRVALSRLDRQGDGAAHDRAEGQGLDRADTAEGEGRAVRCRLNGVNGMPVQRDRAGNRGSEGAVNIPQEGEVAVGICVDYFVGQCVNITERPACRHHLGFKGLSAVVAAALPSEYLFMGALFNREVTDQCRGGDLKFKRQKVACSHKGAAVVAEDMVGCKQIGENDQTDAAREGDICKRAAGETDVFQTLGGDRAQRQLLNLTAANRNDGIRALHIDLGNRSDAAGRGYGQSAAVRDQLRAYIVKVAGYGQSAFFRDGERPCGNALAVHVQHGVIASAEEIVRRRFLILQQKDGNGVRHAGRNAVERRFEGGEIGVGIAALDRCRELQIAACADTGVKVHLRVPTGCAAIIASAVRVAAVLMRFYGDIFKFFQCSGVHDCVIAVEERTVFAQQVAGRELLKLGAVGSQLDSGKGTAVQNERAVIHLKFKTEGAAVNDDAAAAERKDLRRGECRCVMVAEGDRAVICIRQQSEDAAAEKCNVDLRELFLIVGRDGKAGDGSAVDGYSAGVVGVDVQLFDLAAVYRQCAVTNGDVLDGTAAVQRQRARLAADRLTVFGQLADTERINAVAVEVQRDVTGKVRVFIDVFRLRNGDVGEKGHRAAALRVGIGGCRDEVGEEAVAHLYRCGAAAGGTLALLGKALVRAGCTAFTLSRGQISVLMGRGSHETRNDLHTGFCVVVIPAQVHYLARREIKERRVRVYQSEEQPRGCLRTGNLNAVIKYNAAADRDIVGVVGGSADVQRTVEGGIGDLQRVGLKKTQRRGVYTGFCGLGAVEGDILQRQRTVVGFVHGDCACFADGILVDDSAVLNGNRSAVEGENGLVPLGGEHKPIKVERKVLRVGVVLLQRHVAHHRNCLAAPCLLKRLAERGIIRVADAGFNAAAADGTVLGDIDRIGQRQGAVLADDDLGVSGDARRVDGAAGERELCRACGNNIVNIAVGKRDPCGAFYGNTVRMGTAVERKLAAFDRDVIRKFTVNTERAALVLVCLRGGKRLAFSRKIGDKTVLLDLRDALLGFLCLKRAARLLLGRCLCRDFRGRFRRFLCESLGRRFCRCLRRLLCGRFGGSLRLGRLRCGLGRLGDGGHCLLREDRRGQHGQHHDDRQQHGEQPVFQCRFSVHRIYSFTHLEIAADRISGEIGF